MKNTEIVKKCKAASCRTQSVLAIALLWLIGCANLVWINSVQKDRAQADKAQVEAESAYRQYVLHEEEAAQSGCFLYVGDESHVVAFKCGEMSDDTFRTQRAALQWLYDDPATAVDESVAYGVVPTVATDLLVCEPCFVHISFDDVEKSLVNLMDETYTSLFQEPFFAWLKGLHEQYGACFSIYCFADVVQNLPDRYREEFYAASGWLKIGLHADSSDTYGNWDYETGKAAWNAFVEQVYRITGTYDSVDRMPRLHYYAGTEAALLGMRDANVGALGFLCADDLRISYYFGGEEAAYLYSNDQIVDENGLIFLATDMRGDWFAKDFSTANEYRKPIKTTVYKELKYRYGNDQFAYARSSYIFFSHEWKLYDGTRLKEGAQWVEDICRFASEHGIPITYPQQWFYGDSE